VTDCNAERAARFWQRVDVRGPNECWEWQGGRFSSGYGSSSLNDRTISTHRLAWLITYGDVPPLLRHSCDNPICCNVAHLLPGTQADNIADKVERGRQAKGDSVGGFPAQAREWTHCSHGHEFSPENTRMTQEGYRVCRACGRDKQRRYVERHRM